MDKSGVIRVNIADPEPTNDEVIFGQTGINDSPSEAIPSEPRGSVGLYPKQAFGFIFSGSDPKSGSEPKTHLGFVTQFGGL